MNVLTAWLVCLVVASDTTAVLPHRSWQFQDANWTHLERSIPMAKAQGMNRIQLSHNILMDAEQLWADPASSDRLELVRKALALAHAHGLKVDMWTHELSGVPEEYQEKGRVRLSQALWQWLDGKYEQLFTLLPDLDGLVLTFAETDHAIYRDERVISELEPTARFVQMINVLARVCARHHSELIVRTFTYEPQELAWLKQALATVARDVAPQHGNILVMTKCVPHDWTPFYPYNPALGDVGGLPQVVEIDLGQEFTGISRLLHCEVEFVRLVLDHARKRGCIGAVARVERYGYHALGTPNEVNIHAFGRLLHDPTLTTDVLWREWTQARYGPVAAPYVTRALERTFDITNMTLFPLGEWVADHSEIPFWGYVLPRIVSRGTAKWAAYPRFEWTRERFLRPSPDLLLAIDHEKDLARALCRRSLADIERARPHLNPEDYHELVEYLRFGEACIEVFRHHNLALFGAVCVLGQGEPDSVRLIGPGEADALRRTVLEHVAALRGWADRLERQYGGDVVPCRPDRIRRFADETERKLSNW